MRILRVFGFCFPLQLGIVLGLIVAAAAVGAIEHPRIHWAVQTDGPIRGQAALFGDVLYFGSADGNLYAVSKDDGRMLWRYSTGGAIAGAPAVTEDLVVVAGRSERVHALNRGDGTVRWTFTMQPTLPTVTEWSFYTAPPVIADDLVLVPSGDGRLYALELTSGRPRWQFATGDSLRAAPLVAGDVVYQPSGDDHVYALGLRDGVLRWKFATAGVGYDLSQGFIRSDIFTRPSLADGLLVFGSRDANVYAVDAVTGDERWRFAYDSTWAMSTTVDDGLVFVGWSTNNRISALDLKTGAKRWDLDAGSHTYATALVVGDDSYWCSADGRVRRINKTTGEVVWTYDVGADLYASPLHDDGVIYFGTDDGRFLAVGEGASRVHQAVYLPEEVPDSLRGFVVAEELTPYLEERGFERLSTAGALEAWVAARTVDGLPSVVVFAFAQIPPSLIGADPESGALRAYLEGGGKVVWTWGRPNLVTFDEQGNFLAYDPSVSARLLGLRYVSHQDSGNYYSRSTQLGRNWGLPQWFKASFASLHPENDVSVLARDEYGRVNVFVRRFHPRAGSGWVNFGPTGYGTPMRENELAALERVALYGLQ